jgi:hypothetical protein
LPVAAQLAGLNGLERGQKSGNFLDTFAYLELETDMRAYLANLKPNLLILLALSALAIAYPIVTMVMPAIIRAVVPDAVRSVLSLM